MIHTDKYMQVYDYMTYMGNIHLMEFLLETLVQETVEDGVGAGRGHSLDMV